MKRLLLIALLVATPASAQTPPAVPAADPRLQTIPYDPNRVVRLNVAVNFQLTVIFSPDERVENVAIGDSEAWQATLSKRGETLFLKPLRQSAGTNMTVITDTRLYSFELLSTYGSAANSPYTVQFAYPDARADGPAAPAAQPGVGRYRLSGDRRLRPTQVSDDGVRTTIEWGADQMLPAVFSVDRGEEILLDGYVREGRYVIDAVHQRLLFRLDGQTAGASRLRVRDRR
jgi:type IV secretion system protein VirB9